jgi:predicted nucleic acid-binding protein
MCIIIDTNVFAHVFNKKSTFHIEFTPVQEWIIKGKGKIVYGGSKYKKELRLAVKYFKLFVELEKINKTVKLDDSEVDKREREVSKAKKHHDFNDEHLVAMVLASGCRLVCTKDSSAMPFIKDQIFYTGAAKRPRIYSGKKNKDLLNDSNIASICKNRGIRTKKGPGR